VGTFRITTTRRNPGAVVRNIVGLLENPSPPRRRRPPWRRDPDARRAAPAPTASSAAPAPAETGPVTPATLARRARVRK
jgi:shikimate kinase